MHGNTFGRVSSFQVSFFSTSTVLSSRDRYPFFLRTIPSDVHQAQAMVELVRMFGWTYVSVVYEESSYGMQVWLIIYIINSFIGKKKSDLEYYFIKFY